MLFLHVPFCYLNQRKLEPSKNKNEKLKLELKKLIKRETYNLSFVLGDRGGRWKKSLK